MHPLWSTVVHTLSAAWLAVATVAVTGNAAAAPCEDFTMTAIHVNDRGNPAWYSNYLENPNGRFTIPVKAEWRDVVDLILVWLPTNAPNPQLMALAASGPVTFMVNGGFAGTARVGSDLQMTLPVMLEPDPNIWPMTVTIELGALLVDDPCDRHRSVPAVIDFAPPGPALEEMVEVQPCAFCTSFVFDAPTIHDYWVDVCLNWGTNCGKPAADAFCVSQGFAWSTANAVQQDSPPTFVIGDAAVCDQAFCDRFSAITCGR